MFRNSVSICAVFQSTHMFPPESARVSISASLSVINQPDWNVVLSLCGPEVKSKKEKGAPIQRSTETGMAVELTRNMSRQPSRESNNGSMNSYNSEGKSVNLTLPVPAFPSRRCFQATLPINLCVQQFHVADFTPAKPL